MATSVEMPKPGNTVEECELTAWLKHKGDPVTAGDVIAEVETDKATFEVTAPADGIMLDAFFDEGALVPVYTPICVIGAPGESGEGYRPSGDGEAAPRTTAPAGGTRAAPDIAGAPGPARVAPVAVPGRSAAAAEQAAFSPRARRFARDHDIQARPTTGSGPRGRIIEPDLRALSDAVPDSYPVPRAPGTAREELEPGSLAAGAGQGTGSVLPAGDHDAPAAALSPVRQRIAQRMRESLNCTAQYTLNGSANAGGLLAVRRVMKASPATAAITISDLVAFCVVRSLLEAPALNAELADGMLQRHLQVHLGFACDTDRGLLVPVIRDSQRLSLAQLSLQRRELAVAAVRGTLAPDDLTGATFTVANLGSLGVESFTPVLSPPQVAILGVNAIEVKPVRKPDGNIEFIDSIGLSLTLDHQLIDGAPGVRFLNVLAREISNAEALCTT